MKLLLFYALAISTQALSLEMQEEIPEEMAMADPDLPRMIKDGGSFSNDTGNFEPEEPGDSEDGKDLNESKEIDPESNILLSHDQDRESFEQKKNPVTIEDLIEQGDPLPESLKKPDDPYVFLFDDYDMDFDAYNNYNAHQNGPLSFPKRKSDPLDENIFVKEQPPVITQEQDIGFLGFDLVRRENEHEADEDYLLDENDEDTPEDLQVLKYTDEREFIHWILVLGIVFLIGSLVVYSILRIIRSKRQFTRVSTV